MARTIAGNFTLKEQGKLEKVHPSLIRRLTKQAESLKHEGRPRARLRNSRWLAWSLCACASDQTSKA